MLKLTDKQSTVWTTYSSANENLSPKFQSEAFELGKLIGENRDDYCFGGYPGGLMGQVYQGIDAVRKNQDGSEQLKSSVIAVPYIKYYQPSDDHYFQHIHVTHTLKEQQDYLYHSAQHQVALPGGIGTRGEIFSALEENNKVLWLVNVENCFDGFLNDRDLMLAKGTARPEEFANLHVVESVKALQENYPLTTAQNISVKFTGLINPADELQIHDNAIIALPGGGIKQRRNMWSTLEELRCNDAYADKHLYIVNQEGCFDGFLQDIDLMLKNGTAKEKDFSRMRVVEHPDTLRAHGNKPYKPVI